MSTTLSEVDRLRLTLSREKAARLRAESINLQMAQRALEANHTKAAEEMAALQEHLRVTYDLKPGDELLEDGTIKRAPVRELKKEA